MGKDIQKLLAAVIMMVNGRMMSNVDLEAINTITDKTNIIYIKANGKIIKRMVKE